MSDTTIPAVPVDEETLTLAQQARVNLMMLAFLYTPSGHHLKTEARAYAAATEELTQAEFDTLYNIARERYRSDQPPFGAPLPPAQTFWNLAHSVEVESNESAEAYLALGNYAREQNRELALASYLAALAAAEHA